MPASEVMSKFKHGTLHSGSKKGPKVTSRKQAVAIMMSEKKHKKMYEAHGSGKFSPGEIKQGYKVEYNANDLAKLASSDNVPEGMMARRRKPKNRMVEY